MDTSDIIALIALIISGISATTAISSARSSKFSMDRNKEITIGIFKRQGVIDLFETWHNINRIDPNEIIAQDVINVVSALELTAAFWNHNIVEREIILQTFFDAYVRSYDSLKKITTLIPGLNSTGEALLTDPLERAYTEMLQEKRGKVNTSEL